MVNLASEPTEFIASSGNVFADLDLPNADEELAKAKLALETRNAAGQIAQVPPAVPHLLLPTATKLTVRFTGRPVPHATAGYRNWKGQFESTEPIVAVAVVVSGPHVSWARTTHRGTPAIAANILFAPTDEEGERIRVCFSILDATAYGDTIVESVQTQPTPPRRSYLTGELVSIATVTQNPLCELKALFLARRDVVSVRKGAWHARGEVVAPLSEPWRGALTWGRTGEFEVA